MNFYKLPNKLIHSDHTDDITGAHPMGHTSKVDTVKLKLNFTVIHAAESILNLYTTVSFICFFFLNRETDIKFLIIDLRLWKCYS